MVIIPVICFALGICVGWLIFKDRYYDMGRTELERQIVEHVIHSDEFSDGMYDLVAKAFKNAPRRNNVV